LGVGYSTLVEHYSISLTQIRLSPVKSLFFGLFQPILDGVKLISKELVFIDYFVLRFFIFLPFIQFCFSVFFFYLFLFFFSLKYTFIVLFILVRILLYFIFLLSFFSFSKYSILGSLRSVSQAISFDIIFIFLLLVFVFFFKGLVLLEGCVIFLFFLFGLMFFILILTEMNRAPFDFSEGESELVRGYNLELGGLTFCLFFLREYLLILFYVYLFCLIYMSFNYYFGLIIFYLVILVRSLWPRYRYDMLISLF
jgi:NADH:ubiquinone oxidoreductase subunit H